MLLPHGLPHHFHHSRSSNIAGSRLGALQSWSLKAVLGCALQLQLLVREGANHVQPQTTSCSTWRFNIRVGGAGCSIEGNNICLGETSFDDSTLRRAGLIIRPWKYLERTSSAITPQTYRVHSTQYREDPSNRTCSLGPG